MDIGRLRMDTSLCLFSRLEINKKKESYKKLLKDLRVRTIKVTKFMNFSIR